MTEAPVPYNPLDRVELGKSVERALLARPLEPLGASRRFAGAGLYAIYYEGGFEPYADICPPARERGEIPIYVGRARPRGARQGVIEGLGVITGETVLSDRLREHANSIRRVERHAEATLGLTDFSCRYLVCDDIWVPLGEALLIGHYRPLWNVVVDGFGNHTPGKGRAKQARSSWDELHPGREWAADLPPAKVSREGIIALVKAHLAGVTAPNLDVAPDLLTLFEAAELDTAEPQVLPGFE